MNNQFTFLISEIALINKYTNHYNRLCDRASLRSKTREVVKQQLGYVEKHHIVPQSIQPEHRNSRENLIFLTPREHFVAHHLLTKMFTGKNASRMVYAFWQMAVCQGVYQSSRYKITPRAYAAIKQYCSHRNSGINAAHYGHRQPQSAKDTISKTHKGKTLEQYQKDAVSKRHKNIPKSLEHRQKIAHSAGQNRGRIVVFSPELQKSRMVQPSDLEQYLQLGYRRSGLRRSSLTQ